MKSSSTSIASPCVHTCKLDVQQECLGCGRSLNEIVQWSNYSEAEREDIMQRLRARVEQEMLNKSVDAAVAVGEDKHERVTCQRCKERFACKVNSPSRCDCTEVRLTPDEMEYILPLADGECLCPPCLEQLRDEYQQLRNL